MRRKGIFLIFAIFFSVLLATSSFVEWKTDSTEFGLVFKEFIQGTTLPEDVAGQKPSKKEMLEMLTRALIYIEKNYVEEKDPVEVIKSAIDGMLKSLDPFSEFLTPEEYEEWMIRSRGKFGGLGIQIGLRDGWITVISPIEGTPAYRAGIRSGDQIVKIEDESTFGMKLQDAVKKLRGIPGTKVKISIKRPGIDDPFDLTLTREIIEIKSVPYAGVIEDNIGYIRFSQFQENSTKELSSKIDSLQRLNVKGLILDLRSNPGGLLDEAINVADLFLPKGRTIVSTRGRYPDQDTSYFSKKDPVISENIPLVVLVDRGSASASEIVAGALQDWDRALIIGDTTFGKASVQRILPLGKGYEIKLTVAYYYTPSGRNIHKVEKDTALATQEEFKTKILQRKIIGHGGIIPDLILVPQTLTPLTTQLSVKGHIFDFCVRFSNKNPNPPNFSDTREVERILNEFKNYLREKEVKFNEEEWRESKNQIWEALFVELKEKYEGTKGRYMAILGTDPVVKEAVKIIKNSKSTKDLFTYLKSKN